jgi:hypothetical protein
MINNDELVEKHNKAKAAFKAKKEEWEKVCKEQARALRETMGVNELSIEVGSLEVSIAEKYNLLDKLRGSWECPNSPLGKCFYEQDDGAMDDCIFCHEPDERK